MGDMSGEWEEYEDIILDDDSVRMVLHRGRSAVLNFWLAAIVRWRMITAQPPYNSLASCVRVG
jgi:hypothetical protein